MDNEILFWWIHTFVSATVILLLLHNALVVRRLLRQSNAVADVLGTMVGRLLTLASTSADHSDDLARNLAKANVKVDGIASDLVKSEAKVAIVAANLQAAHDRADAIDADKNPGVAADAASRSGDA